jgi:TrmH family RNA methyltransferase
MPAERTPLKPLKWYRKLDTRKHRTESGVFLIEGVRAIRQVVCVAPGSVTELLSVEEAPRDLERVPLRLLTEEQFQSIVTSRTPQGIAAVVRLPADVYSSRLPDRPGDSILMLEDIQDPGNVGTLIRTAAAFDFSGAILTDKCVDPFSPKCAQATAGSVLSLWLRRTVRYTELLASLREQGYTIIAMDLEGKQELRHLERPEKFVLALGNEASGLSSRLLNKANTVVRLPINPDKAESLNVASCGAIGIYAVTSLRTV